jgi:hypothetical protein
MGKAMRGYNGKAKVLCDGEQSCNRFTTLAQPDRSLVIP